MPVHTPSLLPLPADPSLPAPPMPAGDQLQSPDGGIDGKAWRELSNVRNASNGAKALRSKNTGTTAADSGTSAR